MGSGLAIDVVVRRQLRSRRPISMTTSSGGSPCGPRRIWWAVRAVGLVRLAMAAVGSRSGNLPICGEPVTLVWAERISRCPDPVWGRRPGPNAATRSRHGRCWLNEPPLISPAGSAPDRSRWRRWPAASAGPGLSDERCAVCCVALHRGLLSQRHGFVVQGWSHPRLAAVDPRSEDFEGGPSMERR